MMKKKWGVAIAVALIVMFVASSFAEKENAKYYGSKKSDKYHRESCRYVKKIKAENLIEFHSVKEAREAGYIACKVCKPPIKDSSEEKRRKEPDKARRTR